MGLESLMMKMVEKVGTRSIKYVTPVKPGDEEGVLKVVYAQTRQGFGGVVAPFSLHSPSPEITAAIWSITRESLIVGKVARGYKEAIAAAVSKANSCPYCVDAHTISLHAVSEAGAAGAINEGEYERISDPRLRDLVKWASACRSPESDMVQSPPFRADEAAEIIGTAVAFQHINRVSNIFLDDTPMPVDMGSGSLKKMMNRMGGAMMKEIVNRSQPAGESLALLPEAALPEDLSWAASNPHVAGAYARAAAVIDGAAAELIPGTVRRLLAECLETWRGEEMGISRGWLEPAVTGLGETDKPMARLVLLTALASYQVDEKVVNSFRRQFPNDADLITVISWASFTAARRVGSWLNMPAPALALN